MKFGIPNVFVLCAVLLSVDTFAAPVQIINARDESTLAIRAVPKKAPVVKAAPKPAAVPKKAPVVAAPKKAPVPAAAKKAPVVATPKKAPVVAAPKKAPVPATPKKAPVPAAPKKAPVATAPKKTASKSAAPKPTASTSTCSFGSKSKITKPKTIKGRVVSTTQFHATCKNFATSIKSAVQGGTFALQPERIWPNEFTWSGGFYVTPDKEKAQLFGATFLAGKCADKGGVVVMQFELKQTGLNVKEVSSTEANKFRADQSRLAGAIQRILKNLPPTDTTTPADPPADQGISADDNPAVQKPLIALPTQEQLDTIIRPAKTIKGPNLTTLDAFKTVDVVAGAGTLARSQKVTIDDAKEVGIPPLEEPFNQVVLVTDKAMKALRFVNQEDLPTCLAEKQPLLVEFLKKKEEKAKAEDAEAAKKAGSAKTPPRR